MKILMVNKFLYPNGGSETYIFELGRQLEKSGHEVQYFGMEHEGRIVGNRAESYTADMDFHSGGAGKLAYPFKIIYSAEARAKIRPVLEDLRPDVVHLNNINFQLTPSIIYEIRAFEKKNKKRVKIVYTAHDYQWVCPNHMLRIPESGKLCFACEGGHFSNCAKNRCIHNSRLRSLLGSVEAFYYKKRKTYDMVDVIICPSEFIKVKLDTSPILAKKTVTLHNFLDISRPEKAADKTGGKNADGSQSMEDGIKAADSVAWEELRHKLSKRYILYFGRFAKEKGVELLLDVCKRLPQAEFVFAGRGELESEIEALPNAINVGFVRGMTLQKLIEGAQFCVYPAQWYENCPFSIMESQLYKTPVIASDLGGIPELIRDGETGELFAYDKPGQLYDKIKKLWESPEICAAYSENCKNIKFDTIEEYCDKIVNDIY